MATSAYDAIAEWYDQSIRKGALLSANNFVTAALIDTIGDIRGQHICDLACGQGEITRRMARLGAKVVGVDISQKLIEIARRDEVTEPLGITYVQEDAQSLQSMKSETFDGVVCNMALMDIIDLTAAVLNAQRILRAGGWFVMSITHPCFQIPPDRTYGAEGFWLSDNPQGVRGKVGAHHRMLSTYLNAFGCAGFLLEHLAEPILPDRELPPTLVAKYRNVRDCLMKNDELLTGKTLSDAKRLPS